MSVYTSPVALAHGQMQRFLAVQHSHREAHLALVAESHSDHLEFTHGGVSTKQLRQMGHPFARSGAGARGIVKATAAIGNSYVGSSLKKGGGYKFRKQSQIQKAKGKQVLSPLPINLQKGSLRKSLFKTPPAGADHVVYIGFAARHARFVLSPKGTRKMIARGFYSVRAGASGADMGIIARRHKARVSGYIRAVRILQARP